MPIRPPPYTWLLVPTSDAKGFGAAVRDLGRPHGSRVELTELEGGVHVANLVLGRDQVAAAFEAYGFGLEELDPPQEEVYCLALHWVPVDDEHAAPRLLVDPEAADNWAAWSLAGALANQLAERLGGTDITGDPPPWLARELAREEPTPGARQPFVAIRRSPLFPRHSSVFELGRPESLATIRSMLDRDRDQFVACMQVDPQAASPLALPEFFPIGMAMRIVRVVNSAEQVILVAKGIARVRLQRLVTDKREAELEAISDHDEPSINVDDLQRIARFDPLIEASAGVTQVAASLSLGPGRLCDFIAAHGQNSEAYVPVLQALDIAERVRVTRSIFV